MASARDTVFAVLRERLISGHYAADAALVPQALSEEFEVSRTPVREALGLLEQAGLLVAGTRGFTLRQRSEEEMLELFEVRAILESSAAAAAAARRNSLDLARLNELNALANQATDPAVRRRLFNQFHEAVRVAAHNQTISRLLDTLSDQIKMAAPWRTTPDDQSLEASQHHHDAILEALGAGHAEHAQEQMLAHLAHDRDNRIAQFMARATS